MVIYLVGHVYRALLAGRPQCLITQTTLLHVDTDAADATSEYFKSLFHPFSSTYRYIRSVEILWLTVDHRLEASIS